MSAETLIMVNILDSLADATAIGKRGKSLLSSAAKVFTPHGAVKVGDQYQEKTLKLLEAHAKIMPSNVRVDLHQGYDQLEADRVNINDEAFFQSWNSWKQINKYTDGAKLLNKRTQISSKQARSDKLRQTTGAAQRASSITTVHAESPGLNIISADSQSNNELNPFADAAAELRASDGQPGADAETYELEDASSHGSVVLPEVGQAM